MEKSIFEQIGGTNHQDSDYFLPDLLPTKSISLGICGQQRKYYLKTQKNPVYTSLLLSGQLDSYLSEINAHAEVISRSQGA